jgi:hypothetical protein
MKNNIEQIEDKIYTIRSTSVMLDRDLALLYGVETKRINEQVRRNIERFDNDFMFQLTKDEFEDWKSQIEMTNAMKMSLRKAPLAFSEQGVYMLATVLKSKTAVETTKHIMRTFTKMRNFLTTNASIFQRFERLEQRVSSHDEKIDRVFQALENKNTIQSQGIFYDGEIFDAYEFVSSLIKSAKEEIVLVDNYIDETVLTLFSKNQNVEVTIFTKTLTKSLKLDLQKYNEQYRPVKIKEFTNAHDRFLILDKKEVYHIGASLKDLGKKWFAFSKMDRESVRILERLDMR